LLCAGIIGFRALRRTGLPDGGSLGMYGFGGSAHLATRADAREFLAFAARHHLEVTTMPYALEDAGRALADLAADRVSGAAVLLP
jgi:D-arabinose 1-dehydrogenase-like Zn-dependent alcohol dehydrogenase